MSNPITNCATVAIAAITGESCDAIAAGIVAFSDERGGAAFGDDGVCITAVGNYLESRGWEVRYFENDPQIPWTCILSIRSPGHVLALIDGCFHDRANLRFDGCEIDVVMVPPPRGGSKNP